MKMTDRVLQAMIMLDEFSAPAPPIAGELIDGALAQPVAPAPADPELANATLLKSLRLDAPNNF